MDAIQDAAAPKPDVQRGATVFKLVAPQKLGAGDRDRFKPSGANEVELLIPPVPGPENSGKGAAPAPAAPRPVVVAAAVPQADDERVVSKIQELLRVQQRAKELEEENRNLVKMVARLQGELDALKAK